MNLQALRTGRWFKLIEACFAIDKMMPGSSLADKEATKLYFR